MANETSINKSEEELVKDLDKELKILMKRMNSNCRDSKHGNYLMLDVSI